MKYLTIVGIIAVMLFSPELLAMLGWDYSSEAGSGWQKFHPATYILVVTALVSLLTLNRRYWNVVVSPLYGPFVGMTLVLVLWAVIVSRTSSGSNGAIGSSVTSFLTPTLLLISIQSLSRRELKQIGVALRGFMALNSVAAIGEKLLGLQLTYTQTGGAWRSAGFLGHPLNAALLTGMMIVYLASAANRKGSLSRTMPELALHAIAMFTFGSRTGLPLVPAAVAIGALLPSSGVSGKVSGGQRAAIIIVILLAIGATQLPIDFLQDALSRFSEDAGSADSRKAAFEILGLLDRHSILWGIDMGLREALQDRFGTDLAIEISWIALTMTFGLVFVLPLAAAMLYAIYTIARAQDRSAMMVAIYFLIMTAGSISFGSKSMVICQLFLFLLTLCIPSATAPVAAARPAPIDPDGMRFSRAVAG